MATASLHLLQAYNQSMQGVILRGVYSKELQSFV
jgi:hypothetical protein